MPALTNAALFLVVALLIIVTVLVIYIARKVKTMSLTVPDILAELEAAKTAIIDTVTTESQAVKDAITAAEASGQVDLTPIHDALAGLTGAVTSAVDGILPAPPDGSPTP